MPNVEGQQSLLLSDFTYGELSPRMLGRTETAVYHKGAQEIQNFVPMVQGGFRKRTGLTQVGNAHATTGCRLARMVVSGNLWYLLEFTNNYLRIWKNGVSLVAQANIANYSAVTYATAANPAAWDSGIAWDNFYWDGTTLSPTGCEMSGTSETVALVFAGSNNYSSEFTLNSATIHYSDRRPLR